MSRAMAAVMVMSESGRARPKLFRRTDQSEHTSNSARDSKN